MKCLQTRLLELQEKIEDVLNESSNPLRDILEVLRTGTDEQKSHALGVICALRYKGSAPTVLKVFTNREESKAIRKMAGTTLGTIGSKRALKPLIRLLQHDHDSDIKEMAAYALGWLFDKRATPVLISVLLDAQEIVKVRVQSAESLGLLLDEQAIPALISVLGDPSPEVRFWAIYALGEIVKITVIGRLEYIAMTDFTEIPNWGAVSKEAQYVLQHLNSKV